MQTITCHDIAAYSLRYRQQCQTNNRMPTLREILEYIITGGDTMPVTNADLIRYSITPKGLDYLEEVDGKKEPRRNGHS